jgi:TonB family protein
MKRSHGIFIAMQFPGKLSRGIGLLTRLRNCTFRKITPFILAAAFVTSAYGQKSQPSPLPPLPTGKEYGHGCGLAELEVDYETGRVTSARMLVSTGNKKNDAGALQTFRTWVFKPHTPKLIKVPITFADPKE